MIPELMLEMIDKVRTRLDDIDVADQEFEDDYLAKHIQNALDLYMWELPLDRKRDEQLIVVETLIRIVTALKAWADGESYSYKNDAIQITRGLLSKHFQDTIKLLREERLDILGLDGGFA